MSKGNSAQRFVKMHGLGNDFVVLDTRQGGLELDSAQARAIADRRLGVGCDQVIAIEPSKRADAFMRIRNADGGEVEACGNGARCVAAILMREGGKAEVSIETVAGIIHARQAAGGDISVDMGAPRFAWSDIPLARAADTLHLDYRLGPLTDGVAVNMGNPHVVFFVPDAKAVDLGVLGPRIERDPLFPEGVNVEVAQILARDRIRMRVWERGAGITMACGTGACAVLAAAARRKLVDRRATVELDGGDLLIEWSADDRIIMTGPAAESFSGALSPDLAPASRLTLGSST